VSLCCFIEAPSAVQNGDADEGSLMQRLARPPLAHVERRTQVSDSLSLGSGRHHFFASRSFSAALSSMASANSFSLSAVLRVLLRLAVSQRASGGSDCAPK
jgi:hypothetical protein